MRIMYNIVGLLVGVFFSLEATGAEGIELPRVFGDDMVVQRDKPVNVWGWGETGETVIVAFNGQEAKTTVDDDGAWLLKLDPMPANAQPQKMTVSSKDAQRVFENVVIGDVWLCSGQSNMESAAGGIVNSDLDIPLADSEYPLSYDPVAIQSGAPGKFPRRRAQPVLRGTQRCLAGNHA